MYPRFAVTACVLVALAVCWPVGARAQQQAPPAGPGAKFIRQNVFTMPYVLEPATQPERQPVEVRLYVSIDEGKTWHLSSRAAPTQRRFQFRARQDGRYWFALQTLSRRGAAHPPKIKDAGMVVVVDTKLPRLQLTARRGAAGEITSKWKATDPNLVPKSLRIRYQSTTGGPWQEVAIDRRGGGGVVQGEATWYPRASSGPLTIHAEIADAAGNVATSRYVVKPSPGLPDLTARTGDRAKPAQDREARRPMVDVPPSDPAPWPANSMSDVPLGRTAQDRGVKGPAKITPVRSGNRQLVSQPRPADVPSSPVANVPHIPPSPPAMSAPKKSPAETTPLAPPAGERPKVVAAGRLSLDYDLSGVGPSGVAKIELWGTRDGGRTWESYGVDGDHRSPLETTVPGDGLYGFRVVVQNRAGAGGRAPVPGDRPQLWIRVDSARPTARITAAQRAPGGGRLLIRWTASDRALALRPISLMYSARPGGPWSTIASGLENTGSFTWRLGARLPDRIYLRIEAKDEAGNLGVFESAASISLDGSPPAGRLRGASPAAESANADTG